MTRSKNGITAKTRKGPNHQKIPSPVTSTRAQAMNGIIGTISPSSHR